MKKLLSGLLILALCLSQVAFADTFTLKEAHEVAIKNSHELRMLENKLKLAERKLLRAEQKERDTKSDDWKTEAEEIENAKIRLLYKDMEAQAVIEVKQSIDTAKENLYKEITSQFYKLETVLNTLANVEAKIISLQAENKALNLKSSLGLITYDQLLSNENDLAAAQQDLTKAKEDYKVEVMKMNSILNLDLLAETSVVNDMALIDTLKAYDITKNYEQKLTNDTALLNLIKNNELRKKELNIFRQYAGNLSDDEVSTINKMESALEDDVFNIESQKRQLKYDVISKITALKSANDALTLIKTQLTHQELVEKNLQLKYDLGLIDQLTLNKTKARTQELKRNLTLSQLDLTIKVDAFERYLD